MSDEREHVLQQAAAALDEGRAGPAALLLEPLHRRYPDDPRIAFYRGVACNRSGRHTQALALLQPLQKRLADFAPVHAEIASAHGGSGNWADARDCWAVYSSLVPEDPRAELGQGSAAAFLGDVPGAEKHFTRFVSMTGAAAEVAALWQQAGKPQLAGAIWQQILDNDPGDKQARFGLATINHELGEYERAGNQYRRIVSLEPGNADAWRNLGTARKALGDMQEAIECYEMATQLSRMPREGEMSQLLAQDPTLADTSIHSLILQSEQLNYLAATGRLPEKEAAAPGCFAALLSQLAAPEAGASAHGHRIHLSEAQFVLVGRWLHRRVVFGAAPCLPAALNPALDCAAIQEGWDASSPGIVVIDDFLEPAALESLRLWCQQSMFWFDYGKAGGYSGAYMEEGFGNPLLLQIAAELRERLPGILAPHSLQQMWAYIYDSTRSGITPHADAAAVNLNFWITPDDANLDPASGGLAIYLREAPQEWDFARYNNEPEHLRSFVSNAPRRVIPYRCNRLVMFHSNLIHETDLFRFKPGLVNRRINITLLFGERGH